MFPTGLGRRKSEMTLGMTQTRKDTEAKSQVRPYERRRFCRIVPPELKRFRKPKSRTWPRQQLPRPRELARDES